VFSIYHQSITHSKCLKNQPANHHYNPDEFGYSNEDKKRARKTDDAKEEVGDFCTKVLVVCV
jgi:hypothetical protein